MTPIKRAFASLKRSFVGLSSNNTENKIQYQSQYKQYRLRFKVQFTLCVKP